MTCNKGISCDFEKHSKFTATKTAKQKKFSIKDFFGK